MVLVHVLKDIIKPGSKDFSAAADAVDACYQWIIREEFAPLNCHEPKGTANCKKTICTHVRFLAKPKGARIVMQVTEYMVHFCTMKREEIKREVINEWLKVSALLHSLDRLNKLTYMLPVLPSSDVGDTKTHMICWNAIQSLLLNCAEGIFGRYINQWSFLLEARSDGKTGRAGIESNKGKHYLEVYISLKAFFVQLEQERLHFATHESFKKRLCTITQRFLHQASVNFSNKKNNPMHPWNACIRYFTIWSWPTMAVQHHCFISLYFDCILLLGHFFTWCVVKGVGDCGQHAHIIFSIPCFWSMTFVTL